MNTGALIATIILLILSAFFVLAEFAIVRVRATQLEALEGKDPRARTALTIQKNLSHHLSSVLVGITICAIAFGAIGEELFSEPLQHLFGRLPWPWLIKPLASALALLLMTTVHVVLTEMVPRSFAIRAAGDWSLRIAKPLLAWSNLVNPLTWFLGRLSSIVERLLGLPPQDGDGEEQLPTEDEYKHMLNRSQEKGDLELSRKELIENLFDFSKRTVKEIAIPRKNVSCFDLKRTWEENIQLARSTPHTRIPLMEGDLDKVVGVIHIKDLLWALNDSTSPVDLRAIARPPFLVPEMRLIQDLMLDFQKQKQHMALVVNEHGGIDGLITLEDILEELVGEIQDEFDREVIDLRKTQSGAWLAQGTVTLEQLEDHLSLNLYSEVGSISLGGFFQEQLGRILKAGDELRIQGWRLRVLEMRGMAPRKFLLTQDDRTKDEGNEQQ